jgi:hypothetical protein
MFAIASPDASLFQRASGRARQMRQRLLRQHGWARAVRRRRSTDARESGAARTSPRLRGTAGDEVREAFLTVAGGAFTPLSPEPSSPSLNLFY